MTSRFFLLSGLAVAAALLAGCSGYREQRGYILDKELASAIQPG